MGSSIPEVERKNMKRPGVNSRDEETWTRLWTGSRIWEDVQGKRGRGRRKNGKTLCLMLIAQTSLDISSAGLELLGLFLYAVWKARFIFFSFAVCGGSLSGVNGSFSYNSPSIGYVHDVNCFWVVRTEEGKVNVVSPVWCRFHLYICICNIHILHKIHIVIIHSSFIEDLLNARLWARQI